MYVHFLLLLAACVTPASDLDAFERDFTGRTLRFDYLHTGTASEEHVAPERWRIEGPWPGSRTALVDDTDLGKYACKLIDTESARVLWSQGFASIYGEWETTGEAKTIWKAFHESQRLPEPKKPAQVVLEKRAADGSFRELFRTDFEPGSRFVEAGPIEARGEVIEHFVHGASERKVDLLVCAEGYTQAERAKFGRDLERLCGALFATEPFARRKADFNVRGLFVASEQSGISNPRKAVWRSSPFGAAFNAFDSDRYVLTLENARLRELAAQAPYDALLIVVNERKYGGGGIFNLWATCSSDTEPAAYVFVHEFGHSFAGLADEYYTSQVAYESFVAPGVEPWEPNITALLDPARLKWRDLVGADTPLPTAWNQARFDEADLAYQAKRKAAIDALASEEDSERLMREIKLQTQPLLAAEAFAGRVGAFEGAGYQAKGLFRPEVDCIMFTRNPTRFCRVCERAIERVIDRHVGR